MSYKTYLTLIVPAITAFIVAYFAVKFVTYYFKDSGVIAEDKNKKGRPILATSGGVPVAFGIIIGILMYVFGGTFIFLPIIDTNALLSVALSIMLIAFVGFLDDIHVTARRTLTTGIKDIRKGLRQWQKPVLTGLGALPLMAINVGVSQINVPFFGLVNFGIIYPLIIIPLEVIFVSNAFNLLGGFNGLESDTSLVASFGLLVYTTFFGTSIGALLSALLFASILAFQRFNRYKASILPGDSFTYCVGGALAAIMIVGNADAFGAVIFIPWIIEFLLHVKGKFKTSDLGILQKDMTIKAPYGKRIYSLTHVVMNMKKVKEYEVPIYIAAFEALFVILGLIMKIYGVL